jgi:hypothetical protein
MNNEPVAWMWEREINGLAKETIFLTYRPWNENAIPLYTHPAKTLTDDELFKVYADLQEGYTGDNFPVDLGRAILRKAQEK